MSTNEEAFMNGERFMGALSAKLSNGNLISRSAKEAVVDAIKTLKSDLTSCRQKLIAAENNCMKTQHNAAEAAKTAATAGKEAAERIKQFEKEAQLKRTELDDKVTELSFTIEAKKELDKRIEDLEMANAQIQDQLSRELDEVKARESALSIAKKTNEKKMSDVFKGALNAINGALITIKAEDLDVDELLTQNGQGGQGGQNGQGGGFQSSSSGVTDFKKYRTSSRSYNIKELRKKKKESRKKEKERKKGSRKKERRSKKRRKD